MQPDLTPDPESGGVGGSDPKLTKSETTVAVAATEAGQRPEVKEQEEEEEDKRGRKEEGKRGRKEEEKRGRKGEAGGRRRRPTLA